MPSPDGPGPGEQVPDPGGVGVGTWNDGKLPIKDEQTETSSNTTTPCGDAPPGVSSPEDTQRPVQRPETEPARTDPGVPSFQGKPSGNTPAPASRPGVDGTQQNKPPNTPRLLPNKPPVALRSPKGTPTAQDGHGPAVRGGAFPSGLKPQRDRVSQSSRYGSSSVTESLLEVKDRVVRFAKETTSFVEKKSGLNVDDTANDLEHITGVTAKIVTEEFPRTATRVLADAKKTTQSAAQVVGGVVAKTIGAVSVAARRNEKKQKQTFAQEKTADISSTSTLNSARLQRKAERKEALRGTFDSTKKLAGEVSAVAASGVRGASAKAAAGIAVAKAFVDMKQETNKTLVGTRLGDTNAAKKTTPVLKRDPTKAFPEKKAEARSATEHETGANKTRDLPLKKKEAKETSAGSVADRQKKEKALRDDLALARHATRELQRHAVLADAREKEAAKAKGRAGGKAEREGFAAPMKSSDGEKKQSRREGEGSTKRLESMTPERTALRERAELEKTNARSAKQARELVRAREGEEKKRAAAETQLARENARRTKNTIAEPVGVSSASVKKKPSSRFEIHRELAKRPFGTRIKPRGSPEETKQGVCVVENEKNETTLPQSALAFTLVAAAVGVFTKFALQGSEAGVKKARDFHDETKKKCNRAGVDVVVGLDAGRGAAHVTLAPVDATRGAGIGSAASAAYDTHLARTLDFPARVGNPLRIDAALHAMGRRAKRFVAAVAAALAEGEGDAKAAPGSSEFSEEPGVGSVPSGASTSSRDEQEKARVTVAPTNQFSSSSHPASPSWSANTALSPIEEAVRLAELEAASTPAVSAYRKYDEQLVRAVSHEQLAQAASRGNDESIGAQAVSRGNWNEQLVQAVSHGNASPSKETVSSNGDATPSASPSAHAQTVPTFGEKHDPVATVGTYFVTPEASPIHTPRMTPTRLGKALDFDTIGAAADAAVLEALTPRGTPIGTPTTGRSPIGTPTRPGKGNDNDVSYTTSLPRQFTAEEYARAVTKLEGKKETLFATYARLEQSEGREVKLYDFQETIRAEAKAEAVAAATRATPPRRAAPTRPATVPKLNLAGIGGGAVVSDDKANSGELLGTRGAAEADGGTEDSFSNLANTHTETATENDHPGSIPTGRRVSVDEIAKRGLVGVGVGTFSGAEHTRERDSKNENETERDDPTDDPTDLDELDAARATIARLHRECLVLEGRLAFRYEKTRERESTNETRIAEFAEREAEVKRKHARKAVVHLKCQMKRRAVLGWVLYLDSVVKERRVLKKCAARMRARTTTKAFEAWLEYRRLRVERRAEKRLVELQRRADEAERLEMEARRMKAQAAAKAAETASLVADAEARETAARAEVTALKLRSAEKAKGGRRAADSSDDED